MPKKSYDPADLEKAIRGIETGQYANPTAAARAFGLPRTTVRDRYRARMQQPPDPYTGPAAIPAYEDDVSEIPTTVVKRDWPHINIYAIGDIHLGAPNACLNYLDRVIDTALADPYGVVINTGDTMNCAIKTSVSETYHEVMTVREAREYAFGRFKRLGDKYLGGVDGNHEWRVEKSIGDSPLAAVHSALGVAHDRAHMMFRFEVGEQKYDLYLTHGSGGGGTIGSVFNKLERAMNVVEADVFVKGHTHRPGAFKADVLRMGEKGSYRKEILCVSASSMLAMEEYAAIKGYPPAHIGLVPIQLGGKARLMRALV